MTTNFEQQQAVRMYNELYDNRLYKLASQGADRVPWLLDRAILMQDIAIWYCGGQEPPQEKLTQFLQTTDANERAFIALFK